MGESLYRSATLAAVLAFALALDAPASAGEVWGGHARDPQHSALSAVASKPLATIRWQTPVDLAPQFSGNELLIHYGSPLITAASTVIVPVKTGATGGFEVQARSGADGALMWTLASDYILPPHLWTPSFSPALTPAGRMYMPGAGGTVHFRNMPDAAKGAMGRIAFYGLANYFAHRSELDGAVQISTPITSDAAGNIYFGFVAAANSLGLQSGIARISASGVGTWISATAAAADSGISEVVMNSAPALSTDGVTLYVAVSSGDMGRGDLLALNSTTLARIAVRPLIDPLTGQDSLLPDIGSASPTVGPDGRVYFGVLESPFHTSKGWLLSFDGALNPAEDRPPGGFGWDDTASIVPTTMVPSYHGKAPYLLMSKYNNYADPGLGGNGVNKIAILDPTATGIDPRTGVRVMRVVLSIAGLTHDPRFPKLPHAVDEWCINSAVVDPATDSVLAGSEDGKLYRWNLTTNTFTESIVLTPGLGEAYTPTLIGADGTVYAINDATLFAVGPAIAP
jgi:hypothetical protein